VKYLITGATGDVGSKVVGRLVGRGERPRVFVRDKLKACAEFGDRVDVHVGNLADEGSLTAAMEGVDALFLVNSGPRIPVLDALAAKAAKAAGVRHLVKLSSLDVEESLAIGAWHERGEEAIRAGWVSRSFALPGLWRICWPGRTRSDRRGWSALRREMAGGRSFIRRILPQSR
jgi:uncharacterized protein YbjT (DUF2867 family)